LSERAAILYLARHGQTDWNVKPARCQGWAEVPLNKIGRRQAHELGERLAGAGIEAIVSSNLLRARQTADEVHAVLGPDVALDIDPRLAETDRGDWQGHSFAAIKRGSPTEWTAYREHPATFRFPHGESLAEQQRRVLAALRDAIAAQHVTLLVSHGGSLRLVRGFVEGTGIDSFHEMSVPSAATLELDTTGLVERIDRFLESEPPGDET
jgi:probable phosphoglycerate mutase